MVDLEKLGIDANRYTIERKFDFDAYLQEKIRYLGQIGATVSSLPKEEQKSTLEMEGELTRVAVEDKDVKRFIELVDQYVRIFESYSHKIADR